MKSAKKDCSLEKLLSKKSDGKKKLVSATKSSKKDKKLENKKPHKDSNSKAVVKDTVKDIIGSLAKKHH